MNKQVRLLVTGLDGFVGGHVAQLANESYHVIGLNNVNGVSVDLRNKAAVQEAVGLARPDYVLHLAALSFVPESFADPLETYEVNFLGTQHLLQALSAHSFSGKFLLVSSSDTYGLVSENDLPIRENHPLRPRNPYAVSKVAAEAVCFQWSQIQDQMTCMSTRSFNHIGPGQSPRFAVSDFARQISAIRQGKQDAVLKVGNIDTTRDFTDVRDVVRAYLLLLKQGQNGTVYNVCSGQELSLRQIIMRMLDIANVRAKIQQDQGRLRPNEQRRVCGDYSRLKSDTGWQPQISLDQTLTDLLSYWDQVTL